MNGEAQKGADGFYRNNSSHMILVSSGFLSISILTSCVLKSCGFYAVQCFYFSI